MSHAECDIRESVSRDDLALEKPIRGQGTPTGEDFAEGHRLACAMTWKKLVVLLLLLVGTALMNASRAPTLWQAAAYIGCHVAIVGSVFAVSSVLGRWHSDRFFHRVGQLQASFREVVVTDQQVENRYLAGTETYAWTDFSRYRRSDRLIVLFQKGPAIMFQVFPRELFGSATDWERLVALVERKLPRR